MWWKRYFFGLMPCIGILLGLCCRDMLNRVPSTAFSICFAGMAVWMLVAHCQVLRNNPDVKNQPLEQAAEVIRGTGDLFNEDTAVYYSAFKIEGWQYYLAHGDMTPGMINFLQRDLSGEDLSLYNVIYVMEVQEQIPDEAWTQFSESYDIEELNHDYKLYRLTRK